MTAHSSFTREAFAAVKQNDRAGPVHMLNLIRLRDRAAHPDGRQASGTDAYAAYSETSAAVFARLGGRIVWRGGFELMLVGPAAEQWDICFVAEYPSVDAFVAMMRDPVYREAMAHRQAAFADSRLIRLKPLASGSSFGHGLLPGADSRARERAADIG
ncbi:DUF1330 domain-containing protein [Chelatococcus sp. SYSU_G07232]|uniref:DUF1330 domain-containing protein n=1 Tax=Chelatococcus albus TaxID=3047466 RepID=A0ABT7AKM6_9HYPH|nr:DUF1330 domain-containing protein [Chelatococcus sp. SYSU_G07232]MDJ1159919.1 DUF1330 domain-containing protein [Chelatococcus sp. SYSU_G07232]